MSGISGGGGWNFIYKDDYDNWTTAEKEAWFDDIVEAVWNDDDVKYGIIETVDKTSSADTGYDHINVQYRVYTFESVEAGYYSLHFKCLWTEGNTQRDIRVARGSSIEIFDNSVLELYGYDFTFNSGGTAVGYFNAYNFNRIFSEPQIPGSYYSPAFNNIKIVDDSDPNEYVTLSIANVKYTSELHSGEYSYDSPNSVFRGVFGFYLNGVEYTVVGDSVWGGNDEGWHLISCEAVDRVFYIDDIYGTYSGLSSLLFSYWDSGNSVMSSAYTAADIHIYMWLGQDFQGAFSTPYKGYVELFPDSVYTEDGMDIMNLTGVYANGNTAYTFKYGLCDDGNSRGNWTEEIVPPFSISDHIQLMKFGNSETGELYYDADNDRFEFGNNTIATGSTSSVVQDIIDYGIVKGSLIDGNFLNDIYYTPFMRLYVTSGGSDYVYTNPTIAWRELPTHYTVDNQEIAYEFTFRYADWVLKIDTPESNYGTNIRITAV